MKTEIVEIFEIIQRINPALTTFVVVVLVLGIARPQVDIQGLSIRFGSKKRDEDEDQ